MADFVAGSLVLPQAAEQTDFRGEDCIVGNLVDQLFSCKWVIMCSYCNFHALFFFFLFSLG